VTASEMPLNRPPDCARLTWLDDETLERLQRAESQLKRLPACISLSPFLRHAPETQTLIQRLRHPLSSDAMSNAFGELDDTQIEHRFLQAHKRTAIEMAALREFNDTIARSILITDAAQFVAVLEMLASYFLHEVPSRAKTKVRVADVNILPDVNGAYWRCVPASEVMPRLEELHVFIRKNAIEKPLLTAIVALVMIVAIHPFGDGNGRVSRVLFNALLQPGAAADQTFVPLKEIYELSEFGFEIRLRHSMRFNEWSQIVRYFCDVIEFCLAAQESGGLLGH
jgi:Fic family protein